MPLNTTGTGNITEFTLLQKTSMTIVFACICVLGVIGNIIVLVVAFHKHNYRYVTNCYIINLAITDIFFLLISVPLTTYLGLFNTWILNGLVSCRVHVYLAHVLLQATCYTLAVMSIDRCVYIVQSHPRPRWRTPFKAFLICIVIWAVSIAFVFPYTALSPSLETKEAPNPCSVSAHHPFFASCFFPFGFYYVLPLLIIALCYTRLFFRMRHTLKAVGRHTRGYHRGSILRGSRRRVTRTLLSLTSAFAICWFPIHLLELLNCRQMLEGFYERHTRLLNGIRVVAHALSYFNSALNPFLYALINKDFNL